MRCPPHAHRDRSASLLARGEDRRWESYTRIGEVFFGETGLAVEMKERLIRGQLDSHIFGLPVEPVGAEIVSDIRTRTINM
jgi:hypothetical protein